MPKAHTMQTAAPPPGDRPGCALSIAAAVRRAAASSEAGAGDTYLRNADVATRAIRLLLPDEDIDEDTLEFGVSFAWSDVPSPTRLVRSFLEERAAEREVAAVPAATVARRARVQPFVYGVIDGRLYVVPRKTAQAWATFSRALNTSATWGEVTAQAPRRLCREVREALGVRRIAADRDLADIMEELVDEGYPPSLGTIMLADLPNELGAMVQHDESAIGDELPFLPAGALPQVLAVFAARGIPCVEDAALITAMGA